MADADLVLEGGGVKGIAHIGAITMLESNGYRFHRVAGASAGSIAAAFTAGCMKAGRHVAEIEPLMWPGRTPDSIDYRRVAGGRLPIPGLEQIREAMSLVLHEGLFEGDYLRDWIHTTLKKETGIETFKDLRLDDGRGDLTEDQMYSLVVIVVDVSRGSLVRLPWDYRIYGLDPDDQLVADAVRASASIPFFFQPVTLRWGKPTTNLSYLVDGGSCSDFPIEIFDRIDGQAPRWPTFGIKLSAQAAVGTLMNIVDSPLSFALALLEAVVNGNDQVHLADPCVLERTIFVDTSEVGATDFDLTTEQQNLLYKNGQQAASRFLETWRWDAYKTTCAENTGRIARAQAARGDRPIH
jgi:NTE family protein